MKKTYAFSLIEKNTIYHFILSLYFFHFLSPSLELELLQLLALNLDVLSLRCLDFTHPNINQITFPLYFNHLLLLLFSYSFFFYLLKKKKQRSPEKSRVYVKEREKKATFHRKDFASMLPESLGDTCKMKIRFALSQNTYKIRNFITSKIKLSEWRDISLMT